MSERWLKTGYAPCQYASDGIHAWRRKRVGSSYIQSCQHCGKRPVEVLVRIA